METLIHKKVIAATLSTLVLGAAIAQEAATLPPVQRNGQVEYLSGGVGKDEAAVIERTSRQWPLTLKFAVKDKPRVHFAADVEVTVRDAKGQTALQTTSDGPFLLAKLPAGKYVIVATLAGKSLNKQVLVKHGQATKALFMWSPGVDESHS
jgi:hypothetical protein